jgi:hypothetical protein
MFVNFVGCCWLWLVVGCCSLASGQTRLEGVVVIVVDLCDRQFLNQVNLTVVIANWEGISRKASASDNRKGLK